MAKLTAFASIFGGAAAWSATGHMLTAAIAYDNIQDATKTAIDKINDYLNEDYPKTGTSVTETACWADDIKYTEGLESPLHFIDLPVVEAGAPSPVPMPGNSSVNPWAIGLTTATLSSQYAHSLDSARALRFLTHFTGDIHQPLHAASLFSAQFPEGDLGGNDYKIKVTGYSSVSNLHSFWDLGAVAWYKAPERPLNDTGKALIAGLAQSVTTAFPASAFANELAITDPYVWASESNALAESFVYTAPQAPTPLSGDYVTKAQTMCQQRVALGGYRLAKLLDSIYAPASSDGGDFARGVVASIRATRREAVEARGDSEEEGEAGVKRTGLRGAATA